MRIPVALAPVLALLLLLPGAASAHPQPHDEPRILNLRPAPGAVESPGTITVAVLVAADDPVSDPRIVVDGAEVPAASSGGSHPTISGTVQLAAGRHTVQVRATAGGRQVQRSWTFAVGQVAVQRLSGETRVETAVAISRDLYPTGGAAQGALLARADAFPDALASTPLATWRKAPILLTGQAALHPATRSELQRLLPPGATVSLLGGEDALSGAVADEVRDAGFAVERVAGPNRFATAATIASTLPPSTTTVVASGGQFADVLAASSGAAVNGYPLLLATREQLPPETAQALSSDRYERVVVVGGDYALSDAVVQQIREQAPAAEVVRVSGPDPYATAAAVGERFFPDPDHVALASGERFPDALAGGPHAAARRAPVLLVRHDALPAAAAELLDREQPAHATVYGGTQAVGRRVVSALHSQTIAADGPVLRGVSPAAVELDELTELALTFDRAVQVETSTVYVAVGGHEVAGSVTGRDDGATLVFTVDRLPSGLERGTTYPVELTAAATDGSGWRYVARRFEYRREPRPVQEVARFTTPLLGNPDRTRNIHTAADYIDGDVIPAGATYSLDANIGDRTTARGFREVENGCIGAGGEAVDCVGGGISQLATTFMNAAWFTGVKFGYSESDKGFRQHSLYFRRYPVCHESTISSGSIDVVVRNTSPYPITIDTFYSDEFVGVRFLSRPWASVDSWTEPTSPPSSGPFSSRCGRTITYPDGTSDTEAYHWHYDGTGF